MLEWLRRYVRKKMPYVEPQQARAINAKLSLIYAALAWNLIGLTVYWLIKQHVPKTPVDSVDYAKLLGVHNATVIKYSGFRKVNEFDIHLKEEDFDEFYGTPKTADAEELDQK